MATSADVRQDLLEPIVKQVNKLNLSYQPLRHNSFFVLKFVPCSTRLCTAALMLLFDIIFPVCTAPLSTYSFHHRVEKKYLHNMSSFYSISSKHVQHCSLPPRQWRWLIHLTNSSRNLALLIIILIVILLLAVRFLIDYCYLCIYLQLFHVEEAINLALCNIASL